MLSIFGVNNGLPPALKQATIIPIPKGPDPYKGYRPISLLSCLVKVLERVITKRFRHRYDHLIPPNQSGCMARCSTIDPLVRLLHASEMSQYHHNLETEDSESYFAVLFVDFSKPTTELNQLLLSASCSNLEYNKQNFLDD